MSASSVLEDANLLARLEPREYYKKWMEQYYPTRPDQRHALAYRPLSIVGGTIGTAEASATVRLGDTTVIGAIKLEVAEPHVARPDEGFLVTNVTLGAGCSPAVRAGPPSERAQMLSNRMANLLRRLDLLDLGGALVIEARKLVWVLHLDALVLSDAGNLHDAIWLALMAALRQCRLPVVRMDSDTGLIYWDPQTTRPLPLRRLLLPLSFGVLRGEGNTEDAGKESLIADPSEKEEPIFVNDHVQLLLDQHDQSIHALETSGFSNWSLLDGALAADSPIHQHLHSLSKALSSLSE